MTDELSTPSGPWVCPLRSGSNMTTVASCVREQCMLWDIESGGECAYLSMARQQNMIAEALSAIAAHLDEYGERLTRRGTL